MVDTVCSVAKLCLNPTEFQYLDVGRVEGSDGHLDELVGMTSRYPRAALSAEIYEQGTRLCLRAMTLSFIGAKAAV